MGCLTANIRLVSKPCVINVGLMNEPYLINTTLLNTPLKINTSLNNEDYNIHIGLLNPTIKTSIRNLSDGLKVRLGIVCAPNTEAFIRLSPDVLWFFSEKDILDVNVISNIEWIVK